MTRSATILLRGLGVCSVALLLAWLPDVCAESDSDSPAPAGEPANEEPAGDSSETDEVALQRAESKEFIAGDLDAAIAGYNAITKRTEAAAPTRARAALGNARCLRKLGELQKARSALQELIADFPSEAAVLAEARSYLRELDAGKSDSDAFDWLGDLERNPEIQARIFDLAMDLVSPSSDEGRRATKQLLALGPVAIKTLAKLMATSRNDVQRSGIALILVKLGVKSAWRDVLELAASGSFDDERLRREFHALATNLVMSDEGLQALTKEFLAAKAGKPLDAKFAYGGLDSFLRLVVMDTSHLYEDLECWKSANLSDEHFFRIARLKEAGPVLAELCLRSLESNLRAFEGILRFHSKLVTPELLQGIDQALTARLVRGTGDTWEVDPQLLIASQNAIEGIRMLPALRAELSEHAAKLIASRVVTPGTPKWAAVLDLLRSVETEHLLFAYAPGNQTLLPVIAEILRTRAGDAREGWKEFFVGCSSLQESHAAPVIELLEPYIGSENPVLAHFSINALGQISSYPAERFLPDLERLLKRPDYPRPSPPDVQSTGARDARSGRVRTSHGVVSRIGCRNSPKRSGPMMRRDRQASEAIGEACVNRS